MVLAVPSLTLKDIPRALHRELKARAKANHRSLNKEAIATLQSATAATPPPDMQAMMEQAQRSRALFKRPVSARDITRWKRAGRV